MSSPPSAERPDDGAWLPWRTARLNLWLLPLLGVGLAVGRLGREFTISDVYLLGQDAVVVLGVAALLVLLARIRAAPALPSLHLAREHERVTVLLLAVMVAVFAYIGAKLVFADATVSADETMARFDAAILAQGRVMAPVAPAWRAFEIPMAPSFLLQAAGGTHWVSSYLPASAAVQALFLRLGDADLANPLMAGVGLLATWGVGRRLWPERPARAWIAIALLASSAQLLVTAMTAYAMTAHFAFNMVWLWLFLRPGRLGQVAAAAVAFTACGLHQIVFHPLFAAPFVLNLWLGRSWGRAAFHTAVYAAAGLFWSGWFPLAAHLSGAVLPAHAPSPASVLVKLLKSFDPGGPGLMVENLLRFAAWQNPLVWPLWFVGAAAAWRLRGVERALAAGPVLMCAFVLVLLPFQGHGWGYRYLHGFLGSTALVAAVGFTTLLDARSAPGRTALWRGWTACLAIALLALLPLRTLQAWRWAAPQAAALREIRAADADVVVIAATGLFYGWDLTRNDPWLKARPKLMALDALDDEALTRLCAMGRIAVFDVRDGERLGLTLARTPEARAARAKAQRALMAAHGCGAPLQPGLRATSTNSL